jgi:hypothetical protein
MGKQVWVAGLSGSALVLAALSVGAAPVAQAATASQTAYAIVGHGVSWR